VITNVLAIICYILVKVPGLERVELWNFRLNLHVCDPAAATLALLPRDEFG